MFEKIFKVSDFYLVIVLVVILAIMVIPMPRFFIDIFLCVGIAFSIVLLLTAVYATRALDFSIFPSLLLIVTLFRLSLSVATTRVILLRGAEDGTSAAGEVVRSFGEFVVGGNYAVGLVVFIILVIINFVVITKGAGRVAEVAARFTLDAMPGKQMSIDADLNAGLINEEDARKRRQEIAREADFYGAMDGASKFVRGDAIAGILIVIVNIIGGILIGTIQKGLDIGSAASVFTLLTVGDGLVTQIPALIVSTAAGIIVTRTATNTDFSQEVTKQLIMKPKSLTAACFIMIFFGIMPGLPFIPFFILSGILGVISYKLYLKQKVEIELKEKKLAQEKLKPQSEKLENLLPVDILELEVGYGLINIVNSEQNGDLLERITNIRKQFALDLGVIVPSIRIRDNLELKPGDYQIILKGVRIASGSLMVGNLLAMDPGNVKDTIIGIPAKEPAFNLDALWITSRQKDEAIYAGYTVVDLSTIIATHLTEMIRQNIHELLGRQELQSLLDTLKQIAPKVIEDLIPNVLPVGTILKVLKNLLREGVSIRDFRSILEILAEFAPTQKDVCLLTEYVRSGIARTITKKLVSVDGFLKLITLEKNIEEVFSAGIIQTDHGAQLSVDPEFIKKFISQLSEEVSKMVTEIGQAVVLCSPTIRYHIKLLVDRFIPNVTILSHNEITPHIQVQSYGVVRLAYAG